MSYSGVIVGKRKEETKKIKACDLGANSDDIIKELNEKIAELETEYYELSIKKQTIEEMFHKYCLLNNSFVGGRIVTREQMKRRLRRNLI